MMCRNVGKDESQKNLCVRMWSTQVQLPLSHKQDGSAFSSQGSELSCVFVRTLPAERDHHVIFLG